MPIKDYLGAKIDLDATTGQWLADFDDNKLVQPITVEIPDELLK